MFALHFTFNEDDDYDDHDDDDFKNGKYLQLSCPPESGFLSL